LKKKTGNPPKSFQNQKESNPRDTRGSRDNWDRASFLKKKTGNPPKSFQNQKNESPKSLLSLVSL
jgi:hypothetical protein